MKRTSVVPDGSSKIDESSKHEDVGTYLAKPISSIPAWLRNTAVVGTLLSALGCSPAATPPPADPEPENPWSVFNQVPSTTNPVIGNDQDTPQRNFASTVPLVLRDFEQVLRNLTPLVHAQNIHNIHIPEYLDRQNGITLQIDNESVNFDKLNIEGVSIYTAEQNPWIAIQANPELSSSGVGFFVVKADVSNKNIVPESITLVPTDTHGKSLVTLAIDDPNLRNQLAYLLIDWTKNSKQYQKMAKLENSERTYSTKNGLTLDLFKRTVRFSLIAKDKNKQAHWISCTGFPDTERTMITTGHCVNTAVGKLDLFTQDVKDGQGSIMRETFAPGQYKILTTGSDLLSAITFNKKVFNQKTFTFQTMPIRDEEYCAGHFVGYGNNESWVLDSGRIIPKDLYSTSLPNLTYDIARMQPGNSGGPIVNCRTGEVVGIARTTNISRTLTVNYYIPPSVLVGLIGQIYRYENATSHSP